MLCVNAPRKKMAVIHMIVSFVLVIICTVLAFTPLLTISVDKDTKAAIKKGIQTIQENVDDPAIKKALDINVDEDVTLSFIDEINAIKLGIKMISMVSKTVSDVQKDTYNDAETEKSYKELFLNDDGTLRDEIKNSLLVMAAIFGPIVNQFDSNNVKSSAMESIGSLLSSIAGFIFALMCVFFIPIGYFFAALGALISLLKNLDDPITGAAKLAKKMPKSVVHPLTLMLIPCLSPAIGTAISAKLLLVFAAVGTAVNILFTRLHSWDRKEIAYANVVQGVSLISIGAFLFFFLNMLNMGVFRTFFTGLTEYLAKAIEKAVGGKSSGIPSGLVVDIIMVLVALILALNARTYMASTMRRASLACTSKKSIGAHASFIATAVTLILVAILPMIVTNSTAANGKSLLVLSAEQESAMTLTLVGGILVLAVEIALLVLRKKFGKDIAAETITEILSGEYVGPVVEPKATEPAAGEEATEGEVAADTADEAAPAEEASADIAVTDEAPTDETK